MKLKDKVIRISVALALAGFIAANVPVTGVTALAQDGYTDTTDDSGDFLGINGLSNRDVIQASVFGLVAYGVASVISGRTGSAEAGAGGAGGSASAAPIISGDPTKTIWDNLDADARFTNFTGTIQEVDTELRDRLDDASAGPFVVFAPTNSAFGTTPAGASGGQQSLPSPDQMTTEQKIRLVKNHITTGKYSYNDLTKMASGTKLATLSGDFLTITQEDGGMKVNGVLVSREEIQANNGIGAPIDALLVP
jgi:Secreted and surface protein containing fasciclin-like repeats